MKDSIEFYLNDTLIILNDVRGDTSVLDFLRDQRRLVGTKEGCAEGDCGACTVLVGRLGKDGVKYQAINACIAFLPMMDGAHVVTVEALSKRGQLHWVQSALADFHGTQCGFCTPGIVMSLYAMWMSNPAPDRAAIEVAMQGNLCRCTGYASILRGMLDRAPSADLLGDPLVIHREEMRAKLVSLASVEMVHMGSEAAFYIPKTLAQLSEVRKANPKSTIVAGATDVGLWVTKQLRDISPVIFIGQIDELKSTNMNPESDIRHVGAMVTYDQAEVEMAADYPQLADFWPRIAGQQVRNAGTLGGNIANGSPIGDMPPVLIAAGCEVTLMRGEVETTMPLENFFVDYGVQQRSAGDFLQSFSIPRSLPEGFKVFKVSKRPDEDISSVLGAFNIEVEGGTVVGARIAFGGMAATPKRAKNTENALIGQPWNETTVRTAMGAMTQDFTPLSDMRASAAYRMKVAQNMLLRLIWDEESVAAQ